MIEERGKVREYNHRGEKRGRKNLLDATYYDGRAD